MNRTRRLWRYPITRLITMAAVLVMLLGFAGYTSRTTTHAAGNNACQLDSAQGNIKHVIYVQFDNVHFTRDNPHVPSDLEQMPNLLNFMTNNGVLLSDHHTPLIAHTATDILTSLTGVYGDNHGVPVSNSFRYFNPEGTSNTGVSFAYWTSPIFDPATSTPTDTKYNMLTASGQNAPAPWVPYTRAGCNVGSVATANTILENIAIDIPTVFGPNSPQAQEVASNPGQAFADFVGIGIHCAQNNPTCSPSNTGEPDRLPNEPGVPVTYAYLSDAHDAHPSGPAFGPGQAGYVAALAAYDDAFNKFFTRLAKDGIDQSNTLFVFTADEGDHFVGGPPSPANCDGVTTPCTYSQIGELAASMPNLLSSQQGITAPFDIHSDSAPTVYVTGNPARTDTL